MDIRLHLISAPWSRAMSPSAQVGTLKAYVDSVFEGKIKTFAYSAHFHIPLAAETRVWPDFFQKLQPIGEYTYLLLFHRKFRNKLSFTKYREHEARALARINKSVMQQGENLELKDLDILERATDDYIGSHVLPNLTSTGLNVVGFPLNFDQIYASLYFEKFLEQRAPGFKFVFLYGGYCASFPQGLETLRHLKASGYSVIGEGEKKLELILRQLQTRPFEPLQVDGVVKPADLKNVLEKPKEFFASQILDLNTLPDPDYAEFFEAYRRAVSKNPLMKVSESKPLLLIEGTRGCFAHCDFCALNSQWRGFRKQSAEVVFERTQRMIKKYDCKYVYFLDAVCDTWAERFAELVMQNQTSIHFHMELRAHHKESYWVKLSQSGLETVQIGIEALSPPLLQKIGKGTRVIQNLVAQKCFTEMGVISASNLITHHPKSTSADIKETKRVLAATLHLPPILLAKFTLEAESPIFKSLTERERAKVKYKPLIPLAGPFQNYLGNCYLELPSRIRLKASVGRQWDDFKKWYEKKVRSQGKSKNTLIVERHEDGRLLILDKRMLRAKKIYLSGNDVIMYDLCHSGPSMEALIERTGWKKSQVLAIARRLTRKKILLAIDGCFLSLACRPRLALALEKAALKNHFGVGGSVDPVALPLGK